MKKPRPAILILFLVLVFIRGHSQSSSCLQNNFCNLSLCDGCTLPFSNVGVDLNISYGKYLTAANNYPGDVRYQNENDGCTSASNDCVQTDNGVLRYDVYYPSNYTKNQYIQCPLPAVIFVHGGGFSDCNVLGPGGTNPDAMEFAKRGFVFFNIEYRNGRRLSPTPGTYPYITVQQQLAVYRANQDVRGAIRSIIQKQRDEFAKPVASRKQYQIDTNYLFLAGNSAGSITILNVAYYPTQAKINAVNPNQGSFSISQALGPIDADYYYGLPDIDYQSKIKGILDQWGSITIPYGYTSTTAKSFLDPRIPVICFHGEKDKIVDPGIVAVNLAPVDNVNYGNTYNVESSCLITPSFKTNGSTATTPDFFSYGSDSFFYRILQPLNIPSELYQDCQMKHGLDADGANFKSDFGIGNATDFSTVSAVSTYIIGRAATFFQNIIGGNAQARQNLTTTTKVFYENKNSLVGCNLTNNDAGTGNCPN